MKKLKLWNGRGHGKYSRHHINIAAYSQKQAAALLSAVVNFHIGIYEITNYYSSVWGNDMDGIVPTEPGVWVVSDPYDGGRKVERVL